MEAHLGLSTSFGYSSSSDFGTGQSGLYSDKTDVKFDDFKAFPINTRDPYHKRTVGLESDALPGGGTKPGEPVPDTAPTMAGEGFLYASTGGDYMVQVDVDQNTGAYGDP